MSEPIQKPDPSNLGFSKPETPSKEKSEDSILSRIIEIEHAIEDVDNAVTAIRKLVG